MSPEVESALRSPAGFFIVVTTLGETFTCQIVRSARVGEATMRVRRLGRPSELLHLADVVDARRATRGDITTAATATDQDSTTTRTEPHSSPRDGSSSSLGTSDGGSR